MKQRLATAPVCSLSTHPGEVIGIDLGDRLVTILRVEPYGLGHRRGSCPDNTGRYGHEIRGVAHDSSVIEVGTHSAWVSRLLQAQGHDVVVANPRSPVDL